MLEKWEQLKGTALSNVLNLKQANTEDDENERKGRRVYVGNIVDVDRYNLDKYDLYVSMSPNRLGYSVGAHISNAQVGIAGYLEYWHYENQKDANNTFNIIVKKCKNLVEIIGYERPPMTVIVYKLRNILSNIDPHHKEKTGIPMINEYLITEKNSDPRELLYGNRYPLNEPDIMSRNYSDVDTEGSQKVEVKGNKGRQQQYSIKRQADKENNPIKPKTKERRDEHPPKKRTDIPDTHQTKVVASSFYESKQILKDIMSLHSTSLNLDPYQMNRIWNGIIANQLKAKGVPEDHMKLLYGDFMSNIMNYYASTSTRYKMSYGS